MPVRRASLVIVLAVTALVVVSNLPVSSATPPHPVAGGTLVTTRAASGTALSISSFTVNSTSFFLESPFWFNITADGGAPPYSYVYVGLPPGCTTANVSSLNCYPSSAQHYTVRGFVYDTAGDQANATRNFTVKNGFGLNPAILSFQAYPSTVAVGKITYLNVDAVSRSGTPTSELSFVFLGLPSNCGTFNQSNLSCIPNEPGTYKVTVWVTDSYSQSNQSVTFFNVTGTTPTSSQGSSRPSTFDVELIVASVVALIAIVGVVVCLRYIGRPPRRPPPVPPWKGPEGGT